MIIRGYDYKFLYSVGAYLAIDSAKFPKNPTTSADQAKVIFGMACIMSKEYEDSQKLDDPEYKTNYLTPEVLRSVSVGEFEQLATEVNEAVRIGSERTVIAEPLKKTKETGAVK